ncbi:MAG: hypothetical protein ACI96V_000450 [Thalassolituus oleivorans]|jgi:hypothetical protein
MKSDKIPLYIVQFSSFLLFMTSVLNFVIIYYIAEPSEIPIPVIIILLILTAWHFIIWIGLMMREKFGLVLLRGYLSLISLAYPIGTMITRKSVAYLRENQIHKYFDSEIY